MSILTQTFGQLRTAIRDGTLRGERFRSLLARHAPDMGTRGYDELDAFAGELLLPDTLPEPRGALEPEMVAYQPTPVRVLLALLEQAQVTERDVFFDVGAGPGQVAMLAHLLTGATTIGIELEPAYCEYATQRAAELRLDQVTFRNEDARTADYRNGTVFFLYTPLRGEMLQEVLERIRVQAGTFRLLMYGPCTDVAASLPWLVATGTCSSAPESAGSFTAAARRESGGQTPDLSLRPRA